MSGVEPPQKLQEAESLLQEAWEQNPSFDVAYNLGNTAYQLKKHREAAEYLSYALKHWPLMKAAAKLKPTAEQRLAASRAQVGALVVSAGVPGADVLVDGKVVGKAPLDGEVVVEAGEHLVEARLEGYEPAKQSVKVGKGATAEVAMAMVPVKREMAEAPEGQAGVAGGGVPLAARSPAGPVEPMPPPPEKRSWVPVIALGAASVVGLGVGIGTTVASNAASDDAHEQSRAIIRDGGQCVKPPPSWVGSCDQVRSDASSADTFANVARIAYIASGAFAIAAATYALWPKPASAESVIALPSVHQGGAGIVVVGAW